MARGKRFSPEQIIATLRQIEVQLAQGKGLALACKEAGIAEQVVIGAWRDHYNRIRPHAALGYRPPAPVTRAFAHPLPTPNTMQSSHITRSKIPVRSVERSGPSQALSPDTR